MKNTTSFFTIGLLAGLLAAAAAFSLIENQRIHSAKTNALSGSTQSVVLKAAHNLDQTHPVHLATLHLKERLEAYSGGTVTLDLYPAGQLGPQTQCIAQLQNGTLDITVASASPMEGFVPEMSVFSLPYVFRDRTHYWAMLDGPIGRELLLKGVNKKLRGLCYFDAGSRNFYTKDKLIQSPDDLKGVKIRVMNSKTAMDMIRAMGGSPTPISWGELYSSLQQGTVDGAENNLPSFYSSKHYEVCKFFSMDGHTRIPDLVLIAEDVWNKLPEQIQTWVSAAALDASRYQREIWHAESRRSLEAAKAEGVEFFTPDQLPFVEAVEPMLKAYEGTPVGDLLNRIKAVETD